MARMHEDEIRRLKENISLADVCRSRGIELKRHGSRDWVGKCPFHQDKKPSFVVSPDKNLFHCMGCGAAGSVVDLVMKLDGLTFREAVDRLITSTGLVARGVDAEPKKEDERPAVPPERAAQLLERVVALYERVFADCSEGVDYLKKRGIEDKEQLTAHRAGYCNGTLKTILPKSGPVLDDLKALGVIGKSGREHFAGCVVFPVLDVEGRIVTLYGRQAVDGGRRHVFLPARHKGLWNVSIVKTYPEIILVESILDALSVEAAGCSNVVALNGTGGLNDEAVEELRAHGVQKIVLLLDGDPAGTEAAQRIEQRLLAQSAPLAVEKRTLPADHDPNSFLLAFGKRKLSELIAGPTTTVKDANERGGLPETGERADSESAADALPEAGQTEQPRVGEGVQLTDRDGGFTVACGARSYRLMGLEKSPRRLKVTVRVEHAGRIHVDTLDLYSSRSRKILAGDLCLLFDETPETIEADIARLIKRCESARLNKESQDAAPVAVMTPRDKAEAEAFGKASDLVEKILADFEACGLIGEESNKLLGYIAMTSRKRDDPISVLILSSSGAGKTALQDTALSFCPPEDLVKLTALSGKALFYKERLSLKHKVLALEEGDGAEEASYAIRNLISAGELVSESTIKDLATGRLITMENRVEGPTSVFLTTTKPDIDAETKSRFWVTSIDESREQTRRILAFQRRQHLSDGPAENAQREAILKRHRNFQRLLKPLAVKNPYAGQLAYGDDRLQGRRDQPKYLNLIKAIAFLRQMQKETKLEGSNGTAAEYIEVDLDDLALANRLAHEILGHSLDELSRPSRALLLELERMVRERGKQGEADEPQRLNRVAFSRREIRQHTGWSNYRVHTHLRELIEYEYVSVEIDRATNGHRYRLLYEGQGKDGERFMLGLADPDTLRR